MRHSRLGLSPLARGNRKAPVGRAACKGPIPARAGQPRCYGGRYSLPRAYPRSRGATQASIKYSTPSMGLSPLARGNLSVSVLNGCSSGPIPARAGQPHQDSAGVVILWAYPRSRGATTPAYRAALRVLGLSPLARGNRNDSAGGPAAAGPIPARAGQPQHGQQHLAHLRAYPRSRGATSSHHNAAPAGEGLSPLARGNQPCRGASSGFIGPIPARAGQPARAGRRRTLGRAYPRSRGATAVMGAVPSANWGLSPLARGNLSRPTRRGCAGGPIPARAGQPRTDSPDCVLRRAYPRSRGATKSLPHWQGSTGGLSPLARGNPLVDRALVDTLGPIPARAGQPAIRHPLQSAQGAYPRSRGATYKLTDGAGLYLGLSPLARGNLSGLVFSAAHFGPIPARAGQPSWATSSRSRRRAYPRSRGATTKRRRQKLQGWGLSPLARGNQVQADGGAGHVGPIPARAGQPLRRAPRWPTGMAYPRSRGATLPGWRPSRPPWGLSPLARGNRTVTAVAIAILGPIPARAGQPVN